MTDRGPNNEGEGEGAPFSNFPQDPSEFESDPRVSFSKLDDKYILETDDGQEFEYDTALKRWIPTVCAPRMLTPLLSNTIYAAAAAVANYLSILVDS